MGKRTIRTKQLLFLHKGEEGHDFPLLKSELLTDRNRQVKTEADIVTLYWNDIKSTKSDRSPNWASIQPLLGMLKRNPITLLNATAQLALTHHLALFLLLPCL